MQLDFLFSPVRTYHHIQDALRIGSQEVPIQFVRHRRARRYIIRVCPDGSIRATLPQRGSIREARAFAVRNVDWIAEQLQKRQSHPPQPRNWQHGTEILYRGAKVALVVGPNHDGNVVRFADQMVSIPTTVNLRPAVERHLWEMAREELPVLTQDLAVLHGLVVKHVTVRNQRSRWGSCSRRGTISLSWRLIQTPDYVRDYIVLHELMHRREMNHSRRFWQLVDGVCPRHTEAKAWLKKHQCLLR